MATFPLAPDEYLIQCPYNLSHQITDSRILTHLDKCRRNYRKEMADKGKGVEIVPCRFNYAHQYPKLEIDFHHRNCPDQHSVVDHIRYHTSEEFQKMKEETHRQPAPSTSSQNADEDEEDWDQESSAGYEPGYDPTQKLQSTNILYMPRGLSKSERKAFQKQQRERMREMKQEEDYEDLSEEEEYPSHIVAAGTIKK